MVTAGQPNPSSIRLNRMSIGDCAVDVNQDLGLVLVLVLIEGRYVVGNTSSSMISSRKARRVSMFLQGHTGHYVRSYGFSLFAIKNWAHFFLAGVVAIRTCFVEYTVPFFFLPCFLSSVRVLGFSWSMM